MIRELGFDREPHFAAADGGWRLVNTATGAVKKVLNALRGGAQRNQRDEEPAQPVYGISPGLIGRYGQWLTIKPITNSRMIEVGFTSPSPALSQRVANAHARDYIVQDLESKFQLTGEARSFLESEIERVRKELVAAEQALNEFRSQHGVVSVDDHYSTIVERLRDLGHRLTDAEAARITVEAEYRLVGQRESGSLPSVLTSPRSRRSSRRSAIRRAPCGTGRVFLGHAARRSIAAQSGAGRPRARSTAPSAVSVVVPAAGARQKLREEFKLQQAAVLDLRASRASTSSSIKRSPDQNLWHLLQRLQGRRRRACGLSNVGGDPPASLRALRAERSFNLAFGICSAADSLAMAFALETLDSSLKTPDEVRRAARVAGARRGAGFPAPPGGAARNRPLIAMRASRLSPPGKREFAQRTPAAEAYHSIRTSVLFVDRDRPPRSLLITSSQPREGKTSTTVHLALSLAQLSRRVVLVDADMRHARCHHALGVAAWYGLSDVLQGSIALHKAIQRLAVHPGHRVSWPDPGWAGAELHLLQAGEPVGDPSSLLASPAMDDVLQSLLESYEMVLIDSPPVFPDHRFRHPRS